MTLRYLDSDTSTKIEYCSPTGKQRNNARTRNTAQATRKQNTHKQETHKAHKAHETTRQATHHESRCTHQDAQQSTQTTTTQQQTWRVGRHRRACEPAYLAWAPCRGRSWTAPSDDRTRTPAQQHATRTCTCVHAQINTCITIPHTRRPHQLTWPPPPLFLCRCGSLPFASLSLSCRAVCCFFMLCVDLAIFVQSVAS